MASGTAVQEFWYRVRTRPRAPLLRWLEGRCARGFSYAGVGGRVLQWARALVAAGLQNGDRVYVFADDSPERLAIDLAVPSVRGVLVCQPFTTAREGLLPAVADPQFSSVAPRFAIFSNEAVYRRICPDPWAASLQKVVLLEGAYPPTRQAVLSQSDFLALAERVSPREIDRRIAEIRPDDVFLIAFTAATTAASKGILHTHGAAWQAALDHAERLGLGPSDTLFSLVPLQVVGKRRQLYMCIASGAVLGMVPQKNVPKEFRLGLRKLRPTIAFVYAGAFRQIGKRAIALAEKLPVGRAWTRALLRDPSRFDCLRQWIGRLGRFFFCPQLRYFLAGGDFLPEDTREFFLRFGIEVYRAYGMAETGGGVATESPGAWRPGSVGKALPGLQVVRADDGELLLRGRYLMKGYLDPSAAREALRPDGFFATGDLVDLDEDGFVYFRGRKKELLYGEFFRVHAPTVEGLLASEPEIEHAILCGEGRPFLTMLVVPSTAWLERFAASNGLARLHRAEWVRSPELREHIRALLGRKTEHLPATEAILDFELLPEPLSTERGEVLPNGRIRRRMITERYAALIEKMYRRTSAPRLPQVLEGM